MCGIFGATEEDRFKTLYNLNKERGNFSFGCCFVTKDKRTQLCEAQPGAIDVEHFFTEPYYYLLGHTQAPTSSMRDFSRETSHPFITESWVVAHNGVLSNFEELKQKYLPDHINPVDSSIIPALLDGLQEESELSTITSVMEILEGTYSLWIYNLNSKNIYIVRCGSTLYGNALKSEFSSYPDIDLTMLPDNSIFQITAEGLTQISGFDGNSPFFII